LQQDASARDLLAELRQTRSLLAGQDCARPVPESRDFYWSKIVRQIERESAHPGRAPLPGGWVRWLQRAFLPAGGVAVALMLTLVGILWFQDPAKNAAPQNAEISLPEAQTLTFHDYKEQMTVVWLTYNE
jgi:hypothetical protein